MLPRRLKLMPLQLLGQALQNLNLCWKPASGLAAVEAACTCVCLQVYLFLHMCFCATTAAFSWLAWRSFALHTGLLAAMGAVSMWHGASYYFEVFAKRCGAGQRRSCCSS